MDTKQKRYLAAVKTIYQLTGGDLYIILLSRKQYAQRIMKYAFIN